MTGDWPESGIVFSCEGAQLIGILHRPTARIRETGILIVIGGPQYRVGSHRQFVLMARELAADGYSVLRFDYRGMGDSSGAPRTFDSVDEDIRAAVDTLLAEVPSLSSVVILALCDGAAAALIYCKSDSRLGGLVLINPWVRTEVGEARAVMTHYYWDRLTQRSFWAKVLSGGFKPHVALGDFLRILRRALPGGLQSRPTERHFLNRMADGAVTFNKPVLLLLSGRDITAREFEDYCRSSPVWTRWMASNQLSKFHLNEADHTFSAAASLEEASELVLRWLAERIPQRASADL